MPKVGIGFCGGMVKKMKNGNLDLQADDKTAEEIRDRPGKAKALTNAYARGAGRKNSFVLWGGYISACFMGLLVIPVLGVCASVFLLCAIVIPALGTIKLVGALLHWDVVNYIVVSSIDSPALLFAISLFMGGILYVLGKGCWKILLCYIRSVGKMKKQLSTSCR